MKRCIITVLLLIATALMWVVAWFYALVPEKVGNMYGGSTDTGAREIIVPMGGTDFVNIRVDNGFGELLETNQLTFWQFENGRVSRATTDFEGITRDRSIPELTRHYGTYKVSVFSKEGWLRETQKGFDVDEIYKGVSESLTEEKRAETLPKAELPQNFVVVDTWSLPVQTADDSSYYDGITYFNYNYRYQTAEDSISDAVTRVVTLSGSSVDWWYSNDAVFIVKAGNEYACVKRVTYTSCYFISSNDLGYILLNITEGGTK